ncbi:MAG: crossover junction endodeoxyribonuclease RuvC [Candidatus Tectomicrobia bacterium]|nr:crossover junction endodeoxyribonuclease RuvC [Candidatus Tectomicrobia bacterium]
MTRQTERGAAGENVRVLGIDPGSLATGYGVVEQSTAGMRALAWGAVRTQAGQPLPARLRRIYEGLSEVVRVWQPEAAVVEKVFFAENPKAALTLGQARGVAVLTIANAELPLVEYSALEIKQAVVGYGRAAKEQVQEMVRVLLSLPTAPRPADAADALAAAVCHLHSHAWQRKLAP